jgi:galactokinase/mevalonate kinase-like predicted kinase
MIIVQTPLRVSFFGGGTDFPSFFQEHGGCVLTTAIDKYIFVTVKRASIVNCASAIPRRRWWMNSTTSSTS